MEGIQKLTKSETAADWGRQHEGRVFVVAVGVACDPLQFFSFIFPIAGSKDRSAEGFVKTAEGAASAGGAERRALTKPEHSVHCGGEKWKQSM